jgi:hypothetical protein
MSYFGVSAKFTPPFSRIQDSGKLVRGFFLIPESRILLFAERSNPPTVILHYENWGYKRPRRLATAGCELIVSLIRWVIASLKSGTGMLLPMDQ